MRYAVKKLSVMVVTILIVTLLAFLAFQIIPGDPVTTMLGSEYTEARAEALRESYGLNDPLPLRYLRWLRDFFFGDMGMSYTYSLSVRELVGSRVPITLTLTALAFLMIVIVSVPLGLFVSRHRGSRADRAITIINQIFMAVPPFFTGILLTYLFGLLMRWFTPGQYIDYTEDIWGFLGYLVCPAVAIALPKTAMTVKLLKSSVVKELGNDYVRTAYSKGHTRTSVLYSHVLRNAAIPVVTLLGLTVSDIVAGSIIIEQVFSIPGIGRMLLNSIGSRDYPVVQAIVVIIAVIVVVCNYLADVAYRALDPRIRM